MIVLPNWVYRNLNRFGNCALPDVCNKMNTTSLKQHLSRKMGFKVNIREAIFIDSDKYGVSDQRATKEKHYLIAEAIL